MIITTYNVVSERIEPIEVIPDGEGGILLRQGRDAIVMDPQTAIEVATSLELIIADVGEAVVNDITAQNFEEEQ